MLPLCCFLPRDGQHAIGEGKKRSLQSEEIIHSGCIFFYQLLG